MKQFTCPTRLFTGENALDALGEFHVRKALLVTDQFFSHSGIAAAVAARIRGAEVEIFDHAVPDPPAALAAEGAAVCARLQPELLAALGGGSAMDCAKGIRMASEVPMTFVAIPTTSGSGSEVTSFSILTHNGVKHPLVDPKLRPDAAILDASLLKELPKALIADCGMDLLAHCVEAAVAVNRSEMTDALAFHGVRTVFSHLLRSYQGDTAVRGSLHEAATMAGIAFDNAGLGLCHAMAHALGGITHLPHGRLCAMLLPPVMQYNASAALPQYAALARQCGIQAPTERLALNRLTSEIVRLRGALNLPKTLVQAGIPRPQLPEIRQAAVAAAMADPCCGTNPAAVTEEGVLSVLKAVEA